MVGTARSIEITKVSYHGGSGPDSYATRGLGFLVRCATISRQLGQGRQRSGGLPLFMLNICLVILSYRHVIKSVYSTVQTQSARIKVCSGSESLLLVGFF